MKNKTVLRAPLLTLAALSALASSVPAITATRLTSASLTAINPSKTSGGQLLSSASFSVNPKKAKAVKLVVPVDAAVNVYAGETFASCCMDYVDGRLYYDSGCKKKATDSFVRDGMFDLKKGTYYVKVNNRGNASAKVVVGAAYVPLAGTPAKENKLVPIPAFKPGMKLTRGNLVPITLKNGTVSFWTTGVSELRFYNASFKYVGKKKLQEAPDPYSILPTKNAKGGTSLRRSRTAKYSPAAVRLKFPSPGNYYVAAFGSQCEGTCISSFKWKQ